jgi:hypothetical protein
MREKKNMKKQTTARQNPTTTTPRAAAATKATKTQPSPLPPIVQVIPFSQKTNSLSPDDISRDHFPEGLLAWGNVNTAIKYGKLFDVVMVVAEEFPLTDNEFMQTVVVPKHIKVFHVPISEVMHGNVVRETNFIHQAVIEITEGHDHGTIQRKNAIIRKGMDETRSDELIYHFLSQRKRVLVVCIAGRNRSTATILRFLMILSLRHPNDNETSIMTNARHPEWNKNDWEQWLGKKRKFEIFPLNDAQLNQLDDILSSLRINAKRDCGCSSGSKKNAVVLN